MMQSLFTVVAQRMNVWSTQLHTYMLLYMMQPLFTIVAQRVKTKCDLTNDLDDWLEPNDVGQSI